MTELSHSASQTLLAHMKIIGAIFAVGMLLHFALAHHFGGDSQLVRGLGWILFSLACAAPVWLLALLLGARRGRDPG